MAPDPVYPFGCTRIGGKDMVEVMTDKQFKTILEMVDMILDGCKDLDEAKAKLKKLIENQGTKKED
jgi:predicted ArsR family transcriptional regulator